jgi:hypothetical protein
MQQTYDPRNANLLVNVNGELARRDKARRRDMPLCQATLLQTAWVAGR